MKRNHILLLEIVACFILAGGVFFLVMQAKPAVTSSEKPFGVQGENLAAALLAESQPLQPTVVPSASSVPERAFAQKSSVLPHPSSKPAILATPTPIPVPSPNLLPPPTPLPVLSPTPLMFSPSAAVQPAPTDIYIPLPSPAEQNLSFEINDGVISKEESVDINKATAKELEAITGIGPVIAERIVEHRENEGLFQSIEEIQEVSGIGSKTFEKMEDEITAVFPSPVSTPVPASTPLDAVAETQPSEEVVIAYKININTADKEELEKIKGVGPVIAQRIIDYRSSNGPFQALEDLKKVKGIGDKTFLKMEKEITL